MRILHFICILFLTPVIFSRGVDDTITDKDKLLTEEEKQRVKSLLGGRVSKDLRPAKDDWVSNEDRGTVEFNPKKTINIFGREVFNSSNYAFHKVIIPDGTIIREVNFTQKNPETDAISGKNLTFISCNLSNVKLDTSWTIEDCLTIQRREIMEGTDLVTQVKILDREQFKSGTIVWSDWQEVKRVDTTR